MYCGHVKIEDEGQCTSSMRQIDRVNRGLRLGGMSYNENKTGHLGPVICVKGGP